MAESTPPKTMKGRCLCGAVCYEVTGAPKYSGLCYCSDCRKSTGSAFIAFMGFDADKLNVTGETKRYTSKTDTGEQKDITFCPNCSSNLFGGRYGEDEQHTVYAGTLDDEFGDVFEPKMAIYTARRPKWAKVSCELVEFEKMPGGG